jgi:hypothetical protein
LDHGQPRAGVVTAPLDRAACAWCGHFRPINDRALCRTCMMDAKRNDLLNMFPARKRPAVIPARRDDRRSALVCRCREPQPEPTGFTGAVQCATCKRAIESAILAGRLP